MGDKSSSSRVGGPDGGPKKKSWKGGRGFYPRRGAGSGRGYLASSSTVIPGGPADIPSSDAGEPEPAVADIVDLPVPPGCPYAGWSYYFPPSSFGEGNKPPATCVPVFVRYFQSTLFSDHDVRVISSRMVFEVSVVKLCSDPDVQRGLAVALYKDASTIEDCSTIVSSWLFERGEKGVGEALACLGLAMHHVMDRYVRNRLPCFKIGDRIDLLSQELDDTQSPMELLQPRLKEHYPITPMRDLKTELFGKVVTIRGTIVRVGPVKTVCKRMVYKCDSCGNQFAFRAGVTPVLGGSVRITAPEKCPKFDYLDPDVNAKSAGSSKLPKPPDGVESVMPVNSGRCRGKKFSLVLGSEAEWLVDGRTIQLQELMSDGEQRQTGRMPKIIDVLLESDLLSACVTGDVVTVTGLVRVGDPGKSLSSSGSSGDVRTKHMLVLTALNIGNDKDVSRQRTNGYGVYFSDVDHKAFEKILAEENLFRLFVNSLCPAIYGHEIIKAAFVLALFGGCMKGGDGKKGAERDFLGKKGISNAVPTRGDIHVLVVGDPGLGKSQMLKAAIDVAPRGVYVCGNLSTSAGLTVSMNSGCLEAGAVVLSDRGVCCIDEFDKMTKQHESLLEVMEQQTVSVAKAGVACSVPARTTILAAANPKGGHYNPTKTVSENLKLNAPLLSRFDLVFVLIDKNNEEHDAALTHHLLNIRSAKPRGTALDQAYRSVLPNSLSTPAETSLSSRLRPPIDEQLDLIPRQIMRKYVAFARANCHPELSKEAIEVLQNFYVDLRKNQCSSSDAVPITMRQLESLVRLTEARARLELREVATMSDAEDVIELMKRSILQTHVDQYGKVEFERSIHGSGLSRSAQVKRLLASLGDEAKEQGSSVFFADRLKKLIMRYSKLDASTAIRDLNTAGYLISLGGGRYKLTSTDLE